MAAPARKSPGEGNIEPWRGGFRARLTFEHRRRTVYGKTRQDVARKLDELKRQRDEGRWHVETAQTMAELLDLWLESKREKTPKTVALYAIEVGHLKSHLGKIRVDRLTPLQIQAAYAAMEKEGLGSATRLYCHRLLKQVLTMAVRWRLILWNPAAAVDPPRHTVREKDVLTVEQLLTLFTETAGTRWHALWVVLGTTALRISEARAIRWESIDWDTGSVWIREQIQERRGEGYVYTPLKSKNAVRQITFTAEAVEALKAHRALQRREKAAAAEWQEKGLVFTNLHGLPLSHTTINKALDRDLLRQSIVGITPHALRHTAISLWISAGVPVPTVSRWAGHANTETTMRIYAHMFPDQGLEMGNRTDAILRAERARIALVDDGHEPEVRNA